MLPFSLHCCRIVTVSIKQAAERRLKKAVKKLKTPPLCPVIIS